MANIMDYLAWRGDVTLGYSPFNDADSLILAEMSYLTFPQEETPIRDLGLNLPAVEKTQFAFVHEIRALLSAAAMTERFAPVRMMRPIAVTDQDRDMQFAAVTFILPDGTHYIASAAPTAPSSAGARTSTWPLRAPSPPKALR